MPNSSKGNSNIKTRVRALEELEASTGEERTALNPETAESLREFAEEGWRNELEIMAGELAAGREPGLTFRDGIFYTLDGRFAVSPTEQDLTVLWGPETTRQRESGTTERWEEFLGADPEASRILAELEELGEEDEELSRVLHKEPEARLLLSDLCRQREAFRAPQPESSGLYG
jgi:hypothetical protein